jgi:5'-methylthioadenosine nucleosidase
MSENQHVLIMIAMEGEAMPFLQKIGIEKVKLQHPWAPFNVYSGTYQGLKVSVCVNGKASEAAGGVDNVGTTPAAIAAFLMVTELSPSIVINAGTAGGFKVKGAEIADVFIATMFRHHDRRITIPGWDDYARGHHKAHGVPKMVQELGFKEGVVTTGNSLDAHDVDRKIMTENEASVKDMEAAAIAWVCEQSNTPFFAMKVVTDIVDGGVATHEEFMANFEKAGQSLQTNLMRMMDYMVGKGVAEL